MSIVRPHRGEVWWADVPGDKVRPVLVLTRERFIGRLHSVLVAPVTSTVRGIPTEVALGPDDGLPQPCAANFDNLFTLRRKRLRELIACLGDDHLHQVCQAYRFAAGC
ncbi:MAG: type II toxin-antitoxin system PemK/MazF family toxin [Egibacteraceae bacterium]